MTGHIRRRGERSWEIKFDLGTDPATGKRQTRYRSFKGTKREAEAELVKLKAGANRGEYIESQKLNVEEFLERWKNEWARSNLSAKTFESYSQLLTRHVAPRIGHRQIQKLNAADVMGLYSKLAVEGRAQRSEHSKPSGLSPRSISLIHRILHRAFGHAQRWGIIATNPVALAEPPRAEEKEIEILTEDQVWLVLKALKGKPIYSLAVMGLGTGMRRGEMLALRWSDVDLGRNSGARVRVERSLEQTKAGLRFKSPKTRHGRRQIALPLSIVEELRTLRTEQAKLRLSLGLGKAGADALVFQKLEGLPLNPNSVSTEWRRMVKTLKLPKVSLHAWRHTHVSQLIASGMDVLTISRRIGHASPAVTLNVYGHLFASTDDRAAAVFDAAFAGVLTDQVQTRTK